MSPRIKWALARLAYRSFPRLAAGSLAEAASGLSVLRIPFLFSQSLRELPPSLNDELLDIFGRSEKTLTNQFTFQAHSQTFQEEIGWEIHPNAGWRGELHSFDYGLDLALNYRISSEAGYARHLRYLIAHWIGANPPGQGSGWLLGPLSRRVRNWILAADLARQDWESDAIFFKLVTHSLALQSTFLLKYAPAFAFTETAPEAARALLLAGKFFGGLERNELWSAGRNILLNEIDYQFASSGRRAESRPAMQLNLAQAVMEILIFAPKNERGEEDDERLFFKEKLREILKLIEGTLLPDRSLPLFGPAPDSPADDMSDLFALAAVLLKEPVWKNLAGKFGVLPYMLLGESGKTDFDNLPEAQSNTGAASNPQCALYRLSKTSGSAVIINGRLPRTGEDHQDGLTYELAIRGQRVVVDSGAYAGSHDTREKYFSSARAHNVLLVDGKGPHHGGSHHLHPPAELCEVEDGSMGSRLTQRGLPFPGVKHQRAWYCLGEENWAILDRLDGRGRHSAISLIHFYPTLEIEVRENSALVPSHSISLSVIPLRPPGQAPPKMLATRGDHPEFPGWFAPESGMKFPASVLRLEWEDFSLPFVGGYLIVPGPEVSFKPVETDTPAGGISFSLGGKQYCLSVG
ncbi:MAG: heparinase II/III domain-containing protein [Terriglobia bacterium]